MKILFEDYTFNASAKQIRFNTTSVIGLEQLLIITNVTDNIIIYNFADPSAGGTISNNVLTLDYNTVSMSNTDSLQIFIDSLLSPASDETLQYLSDQTVLLRRMVKLLEPSSVQGASGRQQVDINADDEWSFEVDPTSDLFGSIDIWSVPLLTIINGVFNTNARDVLYFS
jgi:hypothetical protein